MAKRKKVVAYVLLAAAAVALSIAAVLAYANGDQAVDGDVIAAVAIGLIAAVAGLATYIHTTTTDIIRAVERAPKDQYWSGYGDGAADALNNYD